MESWYFLTDWSYRESGKAVYVIIWWIKDLSFRIQLIQVGLFTKELYNLYKTLPASYIELCLQMSITFLFTSDTFSADQMTSQCHAHPFPFLFHTDMHMHIE